MIVGFECPSCIGFSSALEESQAYAMQKAGAFEVLDKNTSVTELYSSIQRGVAAVRPVLILDEKSPKTSLESVQAPEAEPEARKEEKT